MDALQKAVDSAANMEVRSSAAEAWGAMNLPADRVKTVILDRTKGGTMPATPAGGPATQPTAANP